MEAVNLCIYDAHESVSLCFSEFLLCLLYVVAAAGADYTVALVPAHLEMDL